MARWTMKRKSLLYRTNTCAKDNTELANKDYTVSSHGGIVSFTLKVPLLKLFWLLIGWWWTTRSPSETLASTYSTTRYHNPHND